LSNLATAPRAVDSRSPPQGPAVRIAWEHTFAMRLRSHDDFELVQALIESGLGDSAIARRTGVPRSTISAWRHGRGSTYHRRVMSATPAWRPGDERAYCYLLGVYLGDGCLNITPRAAASLIISLDSAYSAVVTEVEGAIRATLSDVPVPRSRVRGCGVIILKASHPVLPYAFPSTGRDVSTNARSSSSAGRESSRLPIPNSSCAALSTPTAAGR
jgi:hypothetical protein